MESERVLYSQGKTYWTLIFVHALSGATCFYLNGIFGISRSWDIQGDLIQRLIKFPFWFIGV